MDPLSIVGYLSMGIFVFSGILWYFYWTVSQAPDDDGYIPIPTEVITEN